MDQSATVVTTEEFVDTPDVAEEKRKLQKRKLQKSSCRYRVRSGRYPAGGQRRRAAAICRWQETVVAQAINLRAHQTSGRDCIIHAPLTDQRSNTRCDLGTWAAL